MKFRECLESSLEGEGRADPLFIPDLKLSLALAAVLTWAWWDMQAAGSPAAGTAVFLISGSQGCVLPGGSKSRAVESRSSAGSLNHIPPTQLLSRALIPGCTSP